MLFFVCLCISCAPKVRTQITQNHEPLDFKEQVLVIEKENGTPASAELLGTVKVGDAGMSAKCNYTQVVEKAKEAARKAGGNVVKITEHKTPDFMSSCHRITAEILKVQKAELENLAIQNDPVNPDWDYAVIYVYRKPGTGSLLSYNLHLGDSLLCRVSSRFKQEIKITKAGAQEIWAKTESKSILPIEIIKGKTYYLRCGISMGVMVGRPNLELVGQKLGEKEYATIKSK